MNTGICHDYIEEFFNKCPKLDANIGITQIGKRNSFFPLFKNESQKYTVIPRVRSH
jgi:hypothetical protein